MTSAADDEPGRHDLRDRDAVERPVVRAQRLEDEPDAAVPDEEHRHEVARAKPVAVPAREPEDESASPSQPGERLVEEQRVEGWPSVALGSEPGGQAYSTTRWAQSIAMPHGRFVGGP